MHKLPLFWILVLVIAVGVVVGYYVQLSVVLGRSNAVKKAAPP
jgi:hypothetical protein